jgi:predicted small metal-binding protein
MWRSFCANHNTSKYISCDTNYDKHGHVGFAWGARREVLDEMPLYDKALIGGADHIMAHAAAGQIGHSCITKAFTDDIKAINDWSVLFYNVINGEIGYVKGELYHIWHGDLGKRQYLKRIQDFTSKAKTITERDENGLFITKNGDDEYVKQYFNHREDTTEETLVDDESKNKIREEVRKKQARNVLRQQYPDADNSFIESMIVGYLSDSTMLGTAIGGDLTGAIIGDMLNSNDDTDKYSGGDLSEHNEENFS